MGTLYDPYHKKLIKNFFQCPGDEHLALRFVELGVTTHLLAIEKVELQQQAADLIVLLLQNGMLYSSI